MKLSLGFVSFIALIAGCHSLTIVDPPPPCSSVAPSGGLAVACTPPVTTNPVGLWSGILTTEGSSGTQTFTAEIRAVEGSSTDYTGVFIVGEAVYNVTGVNTGLTDDANAGGEIYIFQIPLEALQPAVTPVEFYGMNWSGSLTDTSFSGDWFFKTSQASVEDRAGTFALEREP